MMIILLCAMLFILFLFLILKHTNPRNKNLPPSPLSLPILGHLHLLKKPLHRSLDSLSQNYGPILYLKFGSASVVVVSSPSVVEQCCHKTNDIILSNRPISLAGKHLSYNFTTIGFAPFGPHWQNLRKLAAFHVFSSASLLKYSVTRTEEVHYLARKLASRFSSPGPYKSQRILLKIQCETSSTLISCNNGGGGYQKADLRALFLELSYNLMMKMVAGKRWSGSSFDIFAANLLKMNVFEYIPILRWIDGIRMEKKLVKLHRERDEFLQGILDECRRDCNGEERKTIVQSLLSLQEAKPQCYTDDILKGIMLFMFNSGTHTTALTLEWTMSLLLNHPKALKKAKIQIEKHVPQGRWLEDSDLDNLPYLFCIINETLRLFPVGPLLVPRLASQDCTINGYHIPRGTTLMVNAWAIHRNNDLWEHPTLFVPERFEGNEVVGNEGYKFVPFGVGRRACPGAGLAMRFMCLAIGVLIQCFEWERVGEESIDLEEEGGLTMSKVTPLETLYRLRPSINHFDK